MLAEGIVADGIIDGMLVAIAHTSARSEKYADIGAATLERWRNQGLSTTATSLVAQQVHHERQIPGMELWRRQLWLVACGRKRGLQGSSAPILCDSPGGLRIFK